MIALTIGGCLPHLDHLAASVRRKWQASSRIVEALSARGKPSFQRVCFRLLFFKFLRANPCATIFPVVDHCDPCATRSAFVISVRGCRTRSLGGLVQVWFPRAVQSWLRSLPPVEANVVRPGIVIFEYEEPACEFRGGAFNASGKNSFQPAHRAGSPTVFRTRSSCSGFALNCGAFAGM